jgi:hypothetical protein
MMRHLDVEPEIFLHDEMPHLDENNGLSEFEKKYLIMAKNKRLITL